MTSGELQLVRQQLLDPKDAPAKPTVEQGEVAVRVPEEALPQVEERSGTSFVLTRREGTDFVLGTDFVVYYIRTFRETSVAVYMTQVGSQVWTG